MAEKRGAAAPKKTSKKHGASATADPTQILNVAFVWDMSGSMGLVWDAAIEGFNTYVTDLKDDEDAETTRFSLTIFDDKFEKWYMDQPVTKIPAISHNRYIPRGATALFDAIARTIGDLDGLLVGDRADEKVLVVVLTDGQENASTEYSTKIPPCDGRERIAKLVSTYESVKGWTFVYLGTEANIQATQHVASGMGMSMGNAANWSRDAGSTSAVYASLSGVTKTRKKSALRMSEKSFADAGLGVEYASTPAGAPHVPSSVAPPVVENTGTFKKNSLSDVLGGKGTN